MSENKNKAVVISEAKTETGSEITLSDGRVIKFEHRKPQKKGDSFERRHSVTIEKLRKNGYHTRVVHLRPEVGTGNMVPTFLRRYVQFSANGGRTMVIVQHPNGTEYVGEALCSEADLYNYKLGVHIALWRILDSFKDEFSAILND